MSLSKLVGYSALIEKALNAIGITGPTVQIQRNKVCLGEGLEIIMPPPEELAARTRSAIEGLIANRLSKHLPALLEAYAKEASACREEVGFQFRSQEILNLYFSFLDRHKRAVGAEPPSLEEQSKVSRQFYKEVKAIGGFKFCRTRHEPILVYSLKPKTIWFLYLGLMRFHIPFPITVKMRLTTFENQIGPVEEVWDESEMDVIVDKSIAERVNRIQLVQIQSEEFARRKRNSVGYSKVIPVHHEPSSTHPTFRKFNYFQPKR